METLTPRQIVNELDKYIIGQTNAKKSVAIALRNRWRRQQVEGSLKNEIMPNNIILIGPTGVGKTEIARRLSKLAKAPFVKVEASKFTEVGYVGRDVESIVRDLMEIAVTMVKAEISVKVEAKAKINVENRILEILLPGYKDIKSDSENLPTWDKMKDRLQKGLLDEKEIEFDLKEDSGKMLQVLAPMGMEDFGSNLKDMFGGMMPKKKKKRKMKISDARKALLEEEVSKLIDHDKAIEEAVRRTENSGIVFLDEIDKIAGGGKGKNGPDVSREGVQRDILPIVEGSTVSTKYGSVKTDHVLFIAAGAFHVAKPSDLIPELQGRFPIRVELDSLSEEDFKRILTEPENALIKQYTALLETESVKLEFSEDAIDEIASLAFIANEQMENIGARRLHTIMSKLLEEILFDTPDRFKGNIMINQEIVKSALAEVIKNPDLSEFIL
ncbi:MAG: ATP-dependent protease ATPase subunit HslU [Calditrichaeota bacterium]|nr:MAG: ATP-dependent protease ATPase subunit HslU [Calditrichota bacterium]